MVLNVDPRITEKLRSDLEDIDKEKNNAESIEKRMIIATMALILKQRDVALEQAKIALDNLNLINSQGKQLAFNLYGHESFDNLLQGYLMYDNWYEIHCIDTIIGNIYTATYFENIKPLAQPVGPGSLESKLGITEEEKMINNFGFAATKRIIAAIFLYKLDYKEAAKEQLKKAIEDIEGYVIPSESKI